MMTSRRRLRLSIFGIAVGAFFFGLSGSAAAWVTPPTDYPDVKIFGGQAQGAKVTFDPLNPKRVIAGIVLGKECFVKSSADGGKTWGTLVSLPQVQDATCWYSPPAVSYSADGSRLYAVYGYSKSWWHGVGFSVSTDHGINWSKPTTLPFPEDEFNYPDVQLVAAPDGPGVYVLVRWDAYFGPKIYFSRSRNSGSTWSPSNVIAADDCAWGICIGNATLAVGENGNVLIAYASGSRYYDDYNALKIQKSIDYGASFIEGVADQGKPSLVKFSDPNIRISLSGAAHLVYQRAIGDASPAIVYKYSLPPYENWSVRPARLDDGVPQANLSSPRLAVGTCEDTSVLHVTWVQSLNGTEQMLYTRRVAQPQYHWSDPLKVIHTKRVIQASDLAATGGNAFSVLSYSWESPVFGTRVWSGVTCR